MLFEAPNCMNCTQKENNTGSNERHLYSGTRGFNISLVSSSVAKSKKEGGKKRYMKVLKRQHTVLKH